MAKEKIEECKLGRFAGNHMTQFGIARITATNTDTTKNRPPAPSKDNSLILMATYNLLSPKRWPIHVPLHWNCQRLDKW